jgi:hypothetical protein
MPKARRLLAMLMVKEHQHSKLLQNKSSFEKSNQALHPTTSFSSRPACSSQPCKVDLLTMLKTFVLNGELIYQIVKDQLVSRVQASHVIYRRG